MRIGRFMATWYEDVWVSQGMMNRWGKLYPIHGRRIPYVRFASAPKPSDMFPEEQKWAARWRLSIGRLLLAWLWR